MIELDIELKQTFFELLAFACVLWSVHKIIIRGIELISKELIERLPEFVLCGRCFSFWFVLITTFDLITAGTIAVFVTLIEGAVLFLDSNSKIDINE